MPRSRSRSVVGLDIEPTYLAAARVRVNGSLAVERAAVAPLEPGIMRDGEVADVAGLATALKAFFAEHDLGKKVRLGVANQRIVVRTLDLPPLGDAKELDAAVRFQAAEQIPMPPDQAVLDYRPLGVVQTPEGERARVVLVAARRDMIERLVAAVREAGLRPAGVDLSAFAMIRAVGGPAAPATAFLAVGGMTNLAVAVGDQCRFTRVLPGGLETMAAALAERQGLTLDDARGWLSHVGLGTPVEDVTGEPAIVAQARTVLEEGVRRLGDEVRNSLDFQGAQGGAEPVSSVVLTDDAADVPGFAPALAEALSLPVAPGRVSEGRPGALDGLPPGRLAVATGLAVTERPGA